MGEGLQESAMVFMQSVARRSGDPFYTVNPADDFRFMFVNDAACRHFGRSREDLLALSMYDVDPLCPAVQWEQLWAEIREQGSIFFETIHRHQNGFDIPVAVSANLFAQGELELFGGCIHDLRAERRTEAALRESEETLRAIFNSTYDAIVLHAPDGMLLDANATFLRMQGLSREAALRLHFNDFSGAVPGAGRLAELWAKVLHGEPQLFEWKARQLREGKEIDLEVFLQKIRFHGKETILANLRDISVRKETERALLRSKEAAEHANRVKSELLANTSHELRTPMTVIMGSLEYLLHSEPAQEHRELLEMADQSAKRLLRIIEDLLDMSRIERGRIHLEQRPFDIRECVQQSSGMFALLARGKGIELTSTVAPQVPQLIIGDPVRVNQILLNLIGNAVKFTDHGRVEVAVATGEKGLLFTVRDTGIGIPDAKLQEIFEPFAQVDMASTRQFGGTGLGLAICRELVHLMGGEIWATSEEEKGSAFFFTLPPKTGDGSTH